MTQEKTKNWFKEPIVLLILIGGLVYFNALFNDFLWDDEEQIVNNRIVHSIKNFFLFFKGSTFNPGGAGRLSGLYYKPLMTVFFSILYTFFGPRPFFFHLFQIVLHIINAILVFLIFCHFFDEKRGYLALFLSLLFLVHPINTETVVYISDLQDVLFFFFGILAFYLILYKDQHLNLKDLSLISLLFLFSLLSKETGFAFFPIVLFYLYLYKRKRLPLYLGAMLGVIFVYFFLRFGIAKIYFAKHGLSPITQMSFKERLKSVPAIIVFYLKTFFFPKDLAINQHWVVRSLNWSEFYLPLLLVILFFGFLITLGFLLKKEKEFWQEYLFFSFWFGMGLGLHLQIFPLDLTVSDRWFYLPMVGLLGLIGIIVKKLKPKKLQIAIFCILISVLSLRTIIRTFDWRDGLTLYSKDIKISKNAFDLENNLGTELFRRGKIQEAKIHFERSTHLAPHWWTNWNNLGVVELRQGNIEKAKEYYQKAIQNGNYYLAYENLASLLLFQEKNPEKAKDFCQKSLQKLPYNPKLWLILSLAEYQLGNKKSALEAAWYSYQLSGDKQALYIYSQLKQDKPLEF